MIRIMIFFLASLGLTALLTALLIRFWPFSIGVDHPDSHRKKHAGPILRLGGMPIFLVFVLMMLLVPFIAERAFTTWSAILFTSGLIFLLGLMDDFRPIGARMKLAGQLAIATLAYFMGLRIEVLTVPMGELEINLAWLSFFVTVIWLISVPNIINLIDGVDGLAGGLGFFLYVTLGYVAWTGGLTEVAAVSLAVAGALAGFLCFNFPPARIFLGDGGAYFIGYGIAALSLQSSQKGSVAAVLLVTVIALGLPIMDTLLALIRRAVRGFPLFRPDAEHIHHRLKGLGFSERRLVLLMYFVTVTLSVLALSVFWSQGRTLPIAVGFLFLLLVLAVRYLGYVWSWADLDLQVVQSFGRRQEVRYVLASARLAELEALHCRTPEEFSACIEAMLNRCGLHVQRPTEGEYEEVVLDFRQADSLVLWVPSSKMDRNHRRRLADCFRPALEAAYQRWGVRRIVGGGDR